jgi:dipeptidyl aminopeptidase/acylaminoacyl peptidase
MRLSLRKQWLQGLCALALTAGLAATAEARTPDFTIEQVMSAPFPSSLAAAPQGGRVAWVYDAGGVRNVWVGEPGPGGYVSKPLTHYTADDGSDVGEVAWAPDGQTVLYIRGGSLEGGGPVNIMSRPEGPPSQDIWAVSVAGGEPRKVGPGHSPSVSPKGDLVAWLAGGQIFVAPLAGGAPKQLIHDRGHDVGFAWSPDGSKLAFSSNRGDHTLTGVYDFKSDTIKWMHPSVDTDFDPTWSPDGAHVAFIRSPAGDEFNFSARRANFPWSIWVADASTGAGHAVWSADPGAGSVLHPLGQSGNLLWAAGDRLVFPWEKTGWTHLWSVSANGGPAAPVTAPGDYEVFNVSLSPDRKEVVYSSNQDDIDHRHIWASPVGGGAARELTGGPTTADFPIVASDGHVLTLWGDARQPMRPVSVDGGKVADLAKAIPADFPASKLVVPQQVIFQSADGMPVHGQLFLPPKGTPSKGPAILFFHGGPIRQMLLGWHPMDAYTYMYAMNQYLASEGYVVLSVNYRGGTGYGMNWREAENFGPSGSSEDNDIVGAAHYLGGRPDVDAKRIGIYGASYGGLMTALGLSRHSDLLAVGVDYAGVHDWKGLLPFLSAPGADPEKAKIAWEASALSTVDKWRSPVLIIHADDDRNVPFSESVKLVEALRAHNVEFEQIVIPDEIHDLLRGQSWLDYFHATDEYLGRKLKP